MAKKRGRPQLPALQSRDAQVLRNWVRKTIKALRMSQAEVVDLQALGKRFRQLRQWTEKNESISPKLFGNNADFRAERSEKWIHNALLSGRRLTAPTAMELFTRVSERVLLNPHGVPRQARPDDLPVGVFRRMLQLWRQDMGPIDDFNCDVYISRENIPALANALADIAVARKRPGESSWRRNRLMTRFADYFARRAIEPPKALAE